MIGKLQNIKINIGRGTASPSSLLLFQFPVTQANFIFINAYFQYSASQFQNLSKLLYNVNILTLRSHAGRNRGGSGRTPTVLVLARAETIWTYTMIWSKLSDCHYD